MISRKRASHLLSAGVAISAASLVALGCMAEVETDAPGDTLGSADTETTAEATEALTNTPLTMHYEGKCEYLKACIPGFNWACSKFRSDWQGGACSNSDFWMSVPSTYKEDLCATKIKVCKGALCVMADVKDVGDYHNWFEASPAVKTALGINNWTEGNPITCASGGGQADVTISSGTWSPLSVIPIGPGQQTTISVSPNSAGNHVLEYAVSQQQSGSLSFTPYWKNNAENWWHQWSAEAATVQARRLPLSSGTADVKYQFVVKNTSAASKTIVVRALWGI